MMFTQKEIIEQLNVKPKINPEREVHIRKDFLKSYLKKVGAKGYVLGISGGQDSTLAGKIAQLAIDELNKEENETYTFIALRLPYGKQFDEDDAVTAINYISPSHTYTINIKSAVDGAQQAFEKATGKQMSDFNKGNTKARERMKVHYDVAAEFNCLVLGTDHGAEAITGFFTKHGDGACDVAPLVGLNKRQGKEILKTLQAPPSTFEKVPTADLESDKPGLPDEEALGITYNEIDDFLEGKAVDKETHDKLVNIYSLTQHKRQMPATIYDSWWK